MMNYDGINVVVLTNDYRETNLGATLYHYYYYYYYLYYYYHYYYNCI